MANEDAVIKALARIKQLQSDIAEDEEAIRNLKSFVAENVEDGESTIDKFKVNVYTYKKFDEAYGKKNAPLLWEMYALEKKVLTSAEAKKVLSEAEYALFQKPSQGGKSVTVEMVDD